MTIREATTPVVRRLLWINHFAVTPREGGGTRHFELARELTKLGWEVTIAATDFHPQSRGFTRRQNASVRTPISEELEGVRILWFWSAPYKRNDWRRALNWLTFARSVGEWGKTRPQFDAVIGSSPHLFAAAAGSRLAKTIGARFVFEVRDLWPESIVAAGGRKGVAYAIFAWMASRLYREADRILVLARGTRDTLVKRGISDAIIVYVPNGVDIGVFERKELKRDHDTFTLVYAGAHGPANGLETVLDAAEILAHDPAIQILLVGDGPAKAELMKTAARQRLTNVEFRDLVPKRELPQLFEEVDAGLMVLRDSPLFAYGVSPNKLFDYLAGGLPVVCNVPGEVAEMLSEAKAGVQARDASATALAAAVRSLRLLSRAQRIELGANGRQWVEREHSRALLGRRLDVFLREMLHSAERGEISAKRLATR